MIVRQGELFSYLVARGECRRTLYQTGSAFIEGDLPHRVVNESSATMELSVVFFTPAGTPQRTDEPDQC